MTILRACSLVALGVLIAAPVTSAASLRRQARADAAPAVQGQAQTPADPTQQRPGRRGGRGAAQGQAPDPDAMGPNQIDQLFDAYMILQAQNALGLTEDQFLTFGQRLRNLQAIRRRVQRERLQALTGFRETLRSPGVLDESAVVEKLRLYDEQVAQAVPELKQAYAAIDQTLRPRQRLQFRIFEEMMERRKLELIAMARQRQQGRGGQAPQTSVKK